ncbi:MAG: LLM class flavin-dependent oxidoreductase, partial [Methanobacteriota archaeon]
MEIGIHTFASADFKDVNGNQIPNDQAINELIDRIEFADKIGIDEVGIGEHHRKEFLDSAAHITLAAAASRTKNIRLASSVTVLSAADPVRVFQNFAT